MALTKTLIIVDEEVNVHDLGEVIRAWATTSRRSRRPRHRPGPVDELDHAAPVSASVQAGDRRHSQMAGGGHVRPWPEEIGMNEDVKERVAKLWKETGALAWPLPPTIVIAVTGASGAVYAERFLHQAAERCREVSLVISGPGTQVLRDELGFASGPARRRRRESDSYAPDESPRAPSPAAPRRPRRWCHSLLAGHGRPHAPRGCLTTSSRARRTSCSRSGGRWFSSPARRRSSHPSPEPHHARRGGRHHSARHARLLSTARIHRGPGRVCHRPRLGRRCRLL